MLYKYKPWQDHIKDFIEVDPEIPCSECIVRVLCSEQCKIWARYVWEWNIEKFRDLFRNREERIWHG